MSSKLAYQENRLAEYFVCPYCNGGLMVSSSELSCGRCDKSYPVIKGVPQFYNGEMYWGDMTRERMRQVLQAAEAQGWQTAIREYDLTDKKKVGLTAYTSEEVRADWSILLPIDRNSKILDIGCGYGALSAALARLSDFVFSIEPVFERCEFTSLRNQQDHLNLFVARAGLPDLPFPDDFFDIIVMNGVLEWVPKTLNSQDPFRTQLDILKLIAGKLKKGGHFILGIENRYSYICFLGKAYHGDIPYTPLMPRFLADLVHRLARQLPYQTRTYGLKALKKLLLLAGFSAADVLIAYPSYQSPHILFNAFHKAPFLYYARNMVSKLTLKSRIKAMAVIGFLKLGLYKYIASHYVGVAKK